MTKQREKIEARRANLSPSKQALLAKRLEPSLEYRAVIPRRPNQMSYPLSFVQERLWFLHQLEPDSSAYNRPLILNLSGTVNHKALEQALSQIVSRHEVLRSTYSVVEGQPRQQIRPPKPICLPSIDLCNTPEQERDQKMNAWLMEEAKRPFDLTENVLRATLLRLPHEEHILALVIHQISFDAWSARCLISELHTCYEAAEKGAECPLPELPIQVADVAYWQQQHWQEAWFEKEFAYWQEQLTDIAPLNLPTDYPRPQQQTYNGGQASLVLSKKLVDSLQSLSQKENVTLFMILLSTFQIMLYRYTSQNDIVVGSLVAGRSQIEVEELIGCFLNTIVLRTDLSGNPTFRQLLARLRQMVLDAYAHQELPFEQLVSRLQPERYLSRNPLFQVLFNFEVADDKSHTGQNRTLTIHATEFHHFITQFDLTVEIILKDQNLHCTFGYNRDLFEADTIKRMTGHFQTLLHGIVRNPAAFISELPLLTEDEYHQIVHEWNDTAVDFGERQTFHALFEQQVERTPDAVAIVFENEQLTYYELNRRANQLARYLCVEDEAFEKSSTSEIVVGVCMNRCPEMVVSLLAILKAGGVYLPLDPALPQDRLAHMLTYSEARVVLTNQSYLAHLSDLDIEQTIQLIAPDSEMAVISKQPAQNLPNDSTPEQLAYVIYTSGSTGLPKGAMVEHQGMVNHLYAKVRDLDLSAKDRIAETAPQSFDISIWQFLAGLLVGGAVHIFDDETVRNPAKLLAKTETEQITVLEVVPSLFRFMLDELAIPETASNRVQPAFTMLRWLLLTGEALPPHLCNQWFGYYPDIPLMNAYGPTECSDDVTHHAIYEPLPPTVTAMPIGRAVANMQLYVLDEYRQPVPIGVPGELYVGGIGVGRGYLHDLERTDQAFLDNPFGQGPGRFYKTGDLVRYQADGVIEFLGRTDFQVKIRGFRIELGEIEYALMEQDEVCEAVVLAREENGYKQLVAYIVKSGKGAELQSEERDPATLQPCNPATLRTALQQTLPDYMIPSVFVFLEVMPLTPNGKLDRRALPAPDYADIQNEFVAPRTQIETEVAAIWQEVLDIEQAGVYDNFFALGGHSLLAIQITSQVRSRFNIDLPLKTIFTTNTMAEFAAIIDTVVSSETDEEY